MFFRVGRENSDENAAKTAKMCVVNANTPCISSSKHIIVSLLALATPPLQIIYAIRPLDKNGQSPVLWCGHEYFNEFSEITYVPDIVALPSTALTIEEQRTLQQQTQLILTVGVAHCVNDDTVATDHRNFQDDLPSHLDFVKQVGIVLAGDAPMPDGRMNYFTKEDAVQQATIIAQYIEKHGYDDSRTAIMVTNGPRTGRYDTETGLAHSPEPHRSGQMDAISELFFAQLQRTIKSSQLFFYDFQFARLSQGPSAYKPMMKQVADSDSGLWFVPSESTSMLAESSFFLGKGKTVVVYHPASENSVHLAYAQETIKQGFIVDITQQSHEQHISSSQLEQASQRIAQALCERILAKATKVSAVVDTLFGKKEHGVLEQECWVQQHKL